MDHCTRATSSNTDNLVEPPILFWLSDSMSDSHHGKNESVYLWKGLNVYELEPMEKMEIDQKIDDDHIIESQLNLWPTKQED